MEDIFHIDHQAICAADVLKIKLISKQILHLPAYPSPIMPRIYF